jgi:hypothetical protein
MGRRQRQVASRQDFHPVHRSISFALLCYQDISGLGQTIK